MLPIPEYPEYLVTIDGRIFSRKSNKWITPYLSDKNYYRIKLHDNGIPVNLLLHRIISRVYGDLPSLSSPLEVDHNDTNTLNNNPSNLIVHSKEEHLSKTLKDRGYEPRQVSECSVCRTRISPGAQKCKEHSQSITSVNITEEQIEYWVRNFSWVRAAKELGMSDNGLRKRYKRLTGLKPKGIKRV